MVGLFRMGQRVSDVTVAGAANAITGNGAQDDDAEEERVRQEAEAAARALARQVFSPSCRCLCCEECTKKRCRLPLMLALLDTLFLQEAAAIAQRERGH